MISVIRCHQLHKICQFVETRMYNLCDGKGTNLMHFYMCGPH